MSENLKATSNYLSCDSYFYNIRIDSTVQTDKMDDEILP